MRFKANTRRINTKKQNNFEKLMDWKWNNEIENEFFLSRMFKKIYIEYR